MIILSLDRIDLAALIKAEYFVAQVQAVGEEAQAFVEAVAALNVKLRMGVEINVTAWTLQAEDGIVGSSILLKGVLENAGVVVGDGEAHRESRFVVSEPSVPVIRCLALE